jgi:glycosyltransferase involved in cell wall biosynthesis
MKQIALLIPTLDRIGGAEQQVLLLAEGLNRRGWRVTVVTLSGTGGEAPVRLQTAGVGFLSLRMRKGLADPRGWIQLNRWLRQEMPDVVHAHLPHAAWMARWSRLGVPVRVLIDTIHTTATGTCGRKLGYRASNWLADRVSAVSCGVADAWSAANMVPGELLVVIPNGVDVRTWRPDAAVRSSIRAELKIEKEFLWLAAGRLEPVKDYPTLFWAFATMPESGRLLVAGSGPLQAELIQLTRALEIENRVRFLGFEPDLRRWMQAADGFVLSSRKEGLPMAVLEAASCGLPAVATGIPGTREAIVDGQTGILAKAVGSAIAMEGAMTRLMRMPESESAAMRQRAREHIVEHFSLEAALDRWEALYTELLLRNTEPKRWG